MYILHHSIQVAVGIPVAAIPVAVIPVAAVTPVGVGIPVAAEAIDFSIRQGFYREKGTGYNIC